MKRYYNKKRFKGLDLKEGNKVWLLYKNFKSRWLSKKLDYIKLGLFKIIAKILEIMYRLDLPAKMKIYSVQHSIMLEPAKGNTKPPLYKMDTYKD